MLTAAMRDRILHHAIVVNLDGESFRRNDMRMGGLLAPAKKH